MSIGDVFMKVGCCELIGNKKSLASPNLALSVARNIFLTALDWRCHRV